MEPATYVDLQGVTHTICAVTLSGLEGHEHPWALTSCGIQLERFESLEVRVATCAACLWANARPGKKGLWVSINEVNKILKVADRA